MKHPFAAVFGLMMLGGVFSARPAWGQAIADEHPVRMELHADRVRIQPGVPFTIGVRLAIQPQWHIYWINPGDSGMPTRLSWDLPPGFVAGPTQYPAPQRFVQPGDLIGYGYADEVMLLTQITPPGQIDSSTVEIKVDAEWLACREVCIPGQARYAVKLAMGEHAPDSITSFQPWAEQMPRLPADPPVADWRWITPDPRTPPSLEVTWSAPPAQVQWFPLPDEAYEIVEVSAEWQGNTTRVTFSTLPPPQGPPRAYGLVAVYVDEQAQRRAIEFVRAAEPAVAQQAARP